jgi:TetR/AcrR family transcriptional repressor of nem operon
VKEQIVAAAVETLQRHGFHASSVQDITEAANVPKGSFSNHFKNKEALAAEALDRYWQRVLASSAALGEARPVAITRLKRYFRYLHDISRKHDYDVGCMIGNMSTEMADHSHVIRDRLAGMLASWTRAIEACVEDAQADGSIRRDLDARTIAAFLLNSWEGAVLRSRVDKTAAPFDAFEKVVFTCLAP